MALRRSPKRGAVLAAEGRGGGSARPASTPIPARWTRYGRPDITVTFGLPKVGMYQSPASGRAGRVQVIDIGIPKTAQDAVQLELLTARWVDRNCRNVAEDANKGTFGKVLVSAGRRAISARRGWWRPLPTARARGSSLSRARSRSSRCSRRVSRRRRGCRSMRAKPAGVPGAAAVELRYAVERLRRAVIGPGMGNDEDTGRVSLGRAARPCRGSAWVVIDADGLNALAAFVDGRNACRRTLS